jgi:hypothetical protein
MVFPDLPSHLAPKVVDVVQAACKDEFVQRGLMIGEFHALNQTTGLRSNTIFPLQTPVPCLAIRNMVPSDFAFLTVAKFPREVRRVYLKAYCNKFGGSTTDRVGGNMVAEAIRQLAELESGSDSAASFQ